MHQKSIRAILGWVLGCALLIGALAAGAAEVGGLRIPDTAKVGASDLVLNGAGIRTRAIFKVYVGALYLAEKKTAAAEALALKGAKRVSLHLLRDLTAEQVGGALNDLGEIMTEAERESFKTQMADLKATMESVGAAKEKSIVTLDFVPDTGLRIALDGVQKGKTIPGEDFYRTLLKLWLGDKPIDRSLKSGMLGAAPQ